MRKKLRAITQDTDVKRSAAYLAISLAVSGIKSLVQFIRERRNQG